MFRTLTSRAVLFTLTLLAGFSLPLRAAQTLSLGPESALWLVGDSTLHPYTSRTTQLTLSTGLDPTLVNSALAAKALDAILQKQALKHWELVVPVTTLKSHESALDKNMYKVLKADQYPEIVFHLTHYDITASTSSDSNVHMKATGTLQIAGQEKNITLEGDTQVEEAVLHVQGQYGLLMSDYGIKPPTMMLGTIKVKDPVIIHFDLRVQISN